MKYFFTADEHFGHKNIIEYCNRPFHNITEMDDFIIQRHNSVVGDGDTVIHAGDFTLKSTQEAENYIRRLKGKHIFLQGSHDQWAVGRNLPYIWEQGVGDHYVVVCHYAMASWPKSHYGSLQLFGHSHGNFPAGDNQLDIGVDCNDFLPISLDAVLQKIKLVPPKFESRY